MIKQRMHRRLSWAVWLCCCLLFSACGDDKPAGSAPGDANNAPQCGGDCPPTELSLNLDDSQQEVVVNGQVAYRSGNHTGVGAGRMLRYQPSA